MSTLTDWQLSAASAWPGSTKACPSAEHSAKRPWTRALFFATVWVCLAEWLRSVAHWGFEWGFLGIALADVDALRQWSSVGGVFALSWLLVGASAVLVELLAATSGRRLALGVGAGV